MARPRTEAGGALLAAINTALIGAGLVWSAVSISSIDRIKATRDVQEIEARALAEAGIEQAMQFVRSTMRLSPFDPLGELDRVFTQGGKYALAHPYVIAEEQTVANRGRKYGTFSVDVTASATGENRDLTITSTGYVPDRKHPRAKATTRAIVRAALETAHVFDYDYFINNWGWFYGDTIYAYGNVRSNAQFDSGNYQPGVYGTPRYESIDYSDPKNPQLYGYKDDNNDGAMDGSDGGIYAGWDIVNASRVRGMGGKPQNQHEFQDQIPMPNLSDLGIYETLAKSTGGTIQIGGGVDSKGKALPNTTVVAGVLGDDPGEMQNLVLIGTASQPIILNGPVVVRGDVIIKGVVTGKGSIYSGRNVYVADNLTYKNAPSSWVPSDESTASTEKWIAANRDKDFAGLFAKQNVVLGDFTDGNWRSYVGWWLSDPMNMSKEDAGIDGLPNTRNGRDGIPGTQDDDLLEGDGKWTVERYTKEQEALGLLPPGKKVGDVIPGTGEDIDGNGVFDDTITLANLDLSQALNSGKWAGNLPAGTKSYSQLASVAMTSLDACVYTNHACAMLTLAWGKDFNWHGAIVSRNESLIYGTNSMNMYYDRRLSGGGMFGNLLPRTVAPLRVLSWSRLKNDAAVLRGHP